MKQTLITILLSTFIVMNAQHKEVKEQKWKTSCYIAGTAITTYGFFKNETTTAQNKTNHIICLSGSMLILSPVVYDLNKSISIYPNGIKIKIRPFKHGFRCYDGFKKRKYEFNKIK